MPIYEILNDEENVVNTIVADEAFVALVYPERWRLAEVQPEPETTEVIGTQITRLAFLSRFTDEEAVALDLASIGATVPAASLRRYMAKVNAASFIDLSREDTRAGVLALEPMGILGDGRALEILDAPIQDHEVPR